jgi:hypothetical protein
MDVFLNKINYSNMKYYATKNGQIIDENNQLIPMDESSPLYQDYYNYLVNDGTVYSSDYEFPNQIIEQALHNETQKYIQRTTDGVNAYAKISAEFRLAKLSGTIDDATHTYLENLLIPVRNEVLAGQWISAKQKLIVIGVAQVGEVLYNRLFEQLSEYIEINY